MKVDFKSQLPLSIGARLKQAQAGFKTGLSTLGAFVVVAMLSGCGGESSTTVFEGVAEPEAANSKVESNVAPESLLQSEDGRLQALMLQATIWQTHCENRQVTFLNFGTQLLKSTTIYFLDDNCTQERQDQYRVVAERYTIGPQVLDPSGVLATQIHFQTVLSDRFDRFVLGNGALFFGEQQMQASYTAQALDFLKPYTSHCRKELPQSDQCYTSESFSF